MLQHLPFTNGSLLFRHAAIGDIPSLQELGVAAYARLKNQMSPENWKRMETVIHAEDNLPPMVASGNGFVCVEKERLVGMAFLVPSGNPTRIYSHETSYIRMVGVHPASGGKGVAQILTRICIDQAKKNQETLLSLHSAEVMYAARHIYEKLGFKKIKMLDAHYGLAYWLYEMKLDH